MNALEAVLCARSLLRIATPLRGDCGRTCGSACCLPDKDGQGGMLLFPGEGELYRPLPPGMSLSMDDSVLPGMTLLTCEGTCDRGARPLACRLFPLIPLLRSAEEGVRLSLAMDLRAWPVCPLMRCGMRGLSPSFVSAAREAAKVLVSCEAHRIYLLSLTVYLDRCREGVF